MSNPAGTAAPTRRKALATFALAALSPLVPSLARAQAPAQPDPWPELARQIFGDRRLEDGAAVLALDAPYRAEDAATVPVTLRLLASPEAAKVRRLTLVIDENPSPLAATITIGEGSGVDRVSTRVRVDSYTNMHAVAETEDGRLLVATRFVKAAGGCSAPALRADAGGVPLGTLRLRRFPPPDGGGKEEAEIMVRHPNYSGMQMDQLTRLYIPAHFVRELRVWQGDALLIAVEGGISISENPEFRFDYRADPERKLRAEVVDSQDRRFTGEWPAPKA